MDCILCLQLILQIDKQGTLCLLGANLGGLFAKPLLNLCACTALHYTEKFVTLGKSCFLRLRFYFDANKVQV